MILATKEDFEKAIINGEEIKKQTVFYTGELDLILSAAGIEIGFFNPKYGVYAGKCNKKNIWIGHKDAPEEMIWQNATEWCSNFNRDNDYEIPYHLPSKEELMLIYVNKDIINKALKDNGCESLKDEWYWSSSEYSYNHAWLQRFSDGYIDWDTKGNNSFNVRPVLAL